MISKSWIRFMAGLAAFLAPLAICSTELIAGDKVEFGAASQTIMAHYDRGYSGCEGLTVDRRASLSVRPELRQRHFDFRSLFSIDSKIEENLKTETFHSLGNAALSYSDGRHNLSMGASHDLSMETLWGCAASVSSRLRREQRILEDLQVSGDLIKTKNYTGMYEYIMDDIALQSMATSIYETGDYGRFQKDLTFMISKKKGRNLLWTVKSGFGAEAIREERYQNLRAGMTLNYKPAHRFATTVDANIQKRGSSERISSIESRLEHQATKRLQLVLASVRVLSQGAPRFSTLSNRVTGSYVLKNSNVRVEVGRVEAERSGNSNDIISISYENTALYRQKIRLKATEGTDFVTVVRKARTLEAGYLFTPFELRSNNNISIGSTYTDTRVTRDAAEESAVRVLEFVVAAVF